MTSATDFVITSVITTGATKITDDVTTCVNDGVVTHVATTSLNPLPPASSFRHEALVDRKRSIAVVGIHRELNDTVVFIRCHGRFICGCV